MKKYIYFIFFFIFALNQVWAKQNKSITKLNGCYFKINNNYIEEIDLLKIKLIEVDVHDYRKWTVNGVRILTNRYRYVPDKYKRRFNSTITVTYEDNSKCVFDGRVRHSGDEKDHIGRLDNSITQSLDVHLENGNIRGITKFKLLRPKTRGNLEDEILITELLRNFNYLAPRTIKVQARVNKVTSTMILQEKAAKEMLEFNKRREGPILEADERFFFKTVSKIEDNHLSGWSAGVVPLMNKSSKYMLSKQVNSTILQKSKGHKIMSLNAVNNLNLIYLYYSNRFQDEINNFNYFDYDLDNTLLGSYEKKKISRLDDYNLFMQSINGTHGLAANNRKYYWNATENYFEPVNYDSNSDISKEIPEGKIRYPISENFYDSFDRLRIKFNNLNYPKILQNLNLSGLNFSEEYLKKKVSKIIENINQVEKNYLNFASKNLIKHNETKSVENILYNYHVNLKDNHPETLLIKNTLDINSFQKCKIFLEMCIEIELSPSELSSLLEGDLEKENTFFQYLGREFNFKSSIEKNSYNNKKFNNTHIYYQDGVNVILDEFNNMIDIKQNRGGAKIFFIGGALENVNINYQGHMSDNMKKIDLIGFPINDKGLTGCLSFINLKVKEVIINASNSTCEDTVNFINASGSLKNIIIKNSMSDALDIDFSNLKIENININFAGNDCVDFSYGNYQIKNLYALNCGDKALSVGEKSKLNIDQINALNSEIGIASKDSSVVNLNKAKFDSLEICLEAYKKKQEFEGGIINYIDMECVSKKLTLSQDKYSLISQRNL